MNIDLWFELLDRADKVIVVSLCELKSVPPNLMVELEALDTAIKKIKAQVK